LPRLVTKVALVIVPLLAITTATVLGSRLQHHPASRPTASRAVSADEVAFLRPRHSGLPGMRPTPSPTPSVAETTSQHVTAPATTASRPRPPAPTPRPVTVGGAAGVQFSLVNQDRAGNGVASLAWSSALARVAQYRAQDMLNRNYFSHYDPSTGQLAFVQLLRLWGIPYTRAGENIAWSTNPSMAQINVMFMNSPEHRANILNPAFHRAGIGVASNGVKTMVVEVFSN
jgi:uncharacterized protein YkwD